MKTPKTDSPTGGRRRILLVDDHAIVREGFAELINSQSGLEVCGQVDTARAAVSAVNRLKPDLVLTDLSLEGRSGLDLIKDLKATHPRLPILVLSMHDETLYAARAISAGARGYVMKQADSGTVMKAIRTVLGGDVFVSEAMRVRVLEKFAGIEDRKSSPLTRLTDRELEVFNLIGKCSTIRQIARQLHLSVSTVESHRARIREKLGVANNNQLIRLAIEQAAKQ